MKLYRKEELKLYDPGDASNKEQAPGLKGSGKIVEEKIHVISDLPNIRAIRPFDQSKGQVCALVPGQALDCGIRPSENLGPFGLSVPSGNEVTYLTAKDALRWRKFSEMLEKHRSQDSHQSIESTLQSKQVSKSTCTLMTHVSDIPNVSFGASHFVPNISLFGMLFIILPAFYGGIHLTAWNFCFPSKTEQLLWRISCSNIMGLIPITWLYLEIADRFLDGRYMDRIPFWGKLDSIFVWSSLIALYVLYILSRLYIVVEAFVSLRHVPIGVYAAVPWVEAIPHV